MSDAENIKADSPEQAEPPMDMPLPPATFEWLVYSLQLDARLSLGLLHFGDEKDAPKPDLKRAQHFIDLLGVIQDKTRGNLNLEEQRLLENNLTELRFRYVQAAEEQKNA